MRTLRLSSLCFVFAIGVGILAVPGSSSTVIRQRLNAGEFPKWTPDRLRRMWKIEAGWSDRQYGDGRGRELMDVSSFDRYRERGASMIVMMPDPIGQQEMILGSQEWLGRDRHFRILKLLGDESPEPVRRALLTVWNCRPFFPYTAEEVAFLGKQLNDPSPRIRILAALALEGSRVEDVKPSGDSVAVDLDNDHPLIKPLRESQNADVRAMAALAFGHDSPDRDRSFAVILQAFDDENRDPTPLVGNWGNDPGFELRNELLRLAGQFGAKGKRVVDELFRDLELGVAWPDSETRWYPRTIDAVRCLVGIGDSAVPQLLQALESSSPKARQIAAIALAAGRREPDKTIPVLLESLRGKCDGYCASLTFHRYDEVELAHFGAAAIPGLMDMLDEEPDSRAVRSAFFCFDQEDRDVVRSFVQFAGDASAAKRIMAISLLGSAARWADDVRPVLSKALKDPNEKIAEAARQAFSNLEQIVGARDRDP